MKQADIRDIKPPVGYTTFFSSRNFFISLAVILGLGGLYFLLKRYFRKKQILKKEISIRPAHEIAYQAFKELQKKNLPKIGKIKEYYIELSGIVRLYLENRFMIKAPEMTTEEFILSLQTADCLSPEQKKLLKEFLQHCDLVKFARFKPESKAIDDSFAAAKRVVDETKNDYVGAGGHRPV